MGSGLPIARQFAHRPRAIGRRPGHPPEIGEIGADTLVIESLRLDRIAERKRLAADGRGPGAIIPRRAKAGRGLDWLTRFQGF